jgi:para-nitrobenzyl esterase
MKAGRSIASLLALATTTTGGIAAPASAQVTAAHVTGGKVVGVVDGDTASFKGLPYAAPPVGPLRWKPPQPVKPWTGTRQADRFGKACMQEPGLAKQMGFDGELGEDCLFIDLWTSARTAAEKRPVIVWIHGGGFNSGMTSVPLYDGANFARQGVVFVSVAYRVGPFGFLATPALSQEGGGASGHYGMLDMIAGLKWVKANVAKFGGDPAKVTIMGHSAGAQAVSRLAASPLASGLFRGVIAQSGTNFSPRPMTLATAEAIGSSFLTGLGARDLRAARALTADQIEAASDARGAPRFALPIDRKVVPDNQIALWKGRRFNDTALLIGHTSDENAAFSPRPRTPAEFAADVRRDHGDAAAALLALYPHASDAEASRSARFLGRDTGTGWGGWTWARLQSAHGKGRVYSYYFDYPTERNPDGSGHGAEVALVFANPDLRAGRAPWSEADRRLSGLMQRYWVNFATSLDPNGPGLPNWPAFAGADAQVMRLGKVNAAGPVPNLDRLRVLDSAYAWRAAIAN